jgi:hypothetical protein
MKNHTRLAVSGLSLAAFAGLAQAQAFTQNFDNVPGLTAQGWFFQNNSDLPPAGNNGWAQGVGAPNWFDSHSGAVTSYALANYAATGGTGSTGSTISAWMLTPAVTLHNGDILNFYTKTAGGFADRLQVRLSTNGASTNVGSGSAGTGDFGVVMLDINPTLVVSGYPTAWTQYSVTVSGISGTPTGRFGLRYFVTDGGPAGNNSNGIGVDDMNYVPTGTPTGACCVTSTGCSVQSQAACTGAGGTYFGNGSTCSASSCPGACCLPDGTCTLSNYASCTAITGGLFQGTNTTCASAACATAQEVVYDNTVTPTGFYSGDQIAAGATTGTERGDQITLAGARRTAVRFDAMVYNPDAAGSGTARVRLYNFPAGGGTDPSGSGPVLWDSGAVPQAFGLGANTLSFTVPNVVVPNEFVWTVTYTLDAPAGANGFGPLMNDPPAVGTSDDFFWENDPAASPPWGQFFFGGAPVANFGAKVFARAATGPSCYANCDSSTAVPFLNVQDFSCFLTKYAAGNAYANCDNSTQPPVLNVSDFSCFLTKYATGCSAP